MSFLEIRFPENISYGSSFGPGWNTRVIRLQSGYEQRNQLWEDTMYKGDVAYGVRSRADMGALADFFQEVRGRAYGFRFKDWRDYEATSEALSPDGSPTVQLIKTYGTGSNNYVREVTKPVSGSVSLERNSSAFASYTLDTTTGIVTLSADSSASISNITQADPGQVTTSSAHGYSTGDEIYIQNAGGMTEVNDTVYTITKVDDTNFTIGVDTSEYTAYTSGGTADKFVQSSETLEWTGEFDVPARFDTDEMSIVWDDYEMLSTSVPIVEVRV